MRNPILFLLPIFMFISTTIIAQEVIKESVKSNQIYSPQATGDNVKFLDEDANELLKVIDEGDFGSLELNSGVPSTTTNKLYNNSGTLHFNGAALGSGGVTVINDLDDAKYDGSSLFVGEDTGNKDDGGNWNTAVGKEALYTNTSGFVNTAIGVQALRNNTTGYYNTASGNGALYSNRTGNRNTANGSYPLYANSGGNNNTASGYEALNKNTTGSSNVAIGHQALYSNTLFSRNVAIGDSALYNNGIGGHLILHSTRNTAIGHKALYSNTTGEQNTANGSVALYANTEGYNNTANGIAALYDNTTGDRNTAMGSFAGPFLNNLDNTTALGYNSRPTGNNTVVIGNSSILSIGGAVSWSIISDGNYKSNVREDVSGLDFIIGLRPITYDLDVKLLANKLGENIRIDKNGNRMSRILSEEETASRQKKASKRNSGFIAQEVEELATSLGYDFSGVEVPENDNSLYRLRYAEFVVPLVKAMQEQQEMIEELKERIAELELEKRN